MRPVAARPELTVIVGLALLNCNTLSVGAAAPVRSGVVEKLSLLAVIGVAEVRMIVLAAVGVPKANSGFAPPPSLVNVRLTSD